MKVPRWRSTDDSMIVKGVFYQFSELENFGIIQFHNDQKRGDWQMQREVEEYFLDESSKEPAFVVCEVSGTEHRPMMGVKRLGNRRSILHDLSIDSLKPDLERIEDPDASTDWDETDVGVDGVSFSYYPNVDLYVHRGFFGRDSLLYSVLRVDSIENIPADI
jgi:hypothetical protein